MVNGRWTVINRKGEELFTPKKLESLGAPSDGMVRFKRNGLYGFLNLKGDVEIEEKYSETPLPFKNGLSRIYTKAVDAGSYLKVRPFGYINKAGKVVWAPQL